MNKLFGSCLSELIGTFVLASAVLSTLTPGNPFPVATPIIAALTLGVYVYIIGGVSGCHINPAVSFAMLVTKNIGFKKFTFYVVCQLIGAYLAFTFIKLYIPEGQESWLVPMVAGFKPAIGEMVGSAFFVFGIFSTVYTKQEKMTSGIIVGTSLLIGILISHNDSFGILNPAVAIAAKSWSFAYIAFPFFGAVIGATLSYILFKRCCLNHACCE